MSLFKKPAFVRWATALVVALIALSLGAIATLGYLLLQPEPKGLPLPLASSTPSPAATRAQGALPALPTVTLTPVSGPKAGIETAVQPSPAPNSTVVPSGTSSGTATAAASSTSAGTTAAVDESPASSWTPGPLSQHPTFEPTTMPCIDCHQDVLGDKE